MVEPNVSIVIVTFNSRNELLACLKSCEGLHYTNYEIVVIDNGSRDALALPGLQGWSKHVRTVLRSPVNLGYPKAANLGIQDALAQEMDYVLLLNDDTEVAPDFLGVLVNAAEDMPRVGAVGPVIYYFIEPRKVWFAGGWFDRQACAIQVPTPEQLDQGGETAPVEFEYLTGCCLLVKRKVIDAIGLFDERFYLYWEDADWILRMTAAGFRLAMVPQAHIWHKISVSVGGPDSPMKAYHKTRSHLLFASKHASHALPGLYRTALRDAGWLLLKSSDSNRFVRARAYLAAVKDYHLGRTGKGPEWLWQSR